MPFFINPFYLLIVTLPTIAISGIASLMVRAAFNKYSRVRTMNGYTGAQAAQVLLDGAGIHDVRIVRSHGHLSDHYSPVNKQLALSEKVHDSTSVAAVGIACHEAGHAIQHARNYAPLWMRSALVPVAGIGSNIGMIMMVLGLVISSSVGQYMVMAGAVLFSGVLLFQLVTLPVEFDATARAKRLIVESGIIYPEERRGVDSVLNAAAMTYVAAVIGTVLTLVYFLLRAGLLGQRDD